MCFGVLGRGAAYWTQRSRDKQSSTANSRWPAKPASLARAELRAVRFEGTHCELFGEQLPEVTRLTVEWFVKHLGVQAESSPRARAAALN